MYLCKYFTWKNIKQILCYHIICNKNNNIIDSSRLFSMEKDIKILKTIAGVHSDQIVVL